MLTDPIADYLTRIRNAVSARHRVVEIPSSKMKKEMTYTIVPETEADIKSLKISVKSPIAKGLLGKTVGEKVEITVPAGKLELEILDIKRG